jgi:hypothetical protein
MISAREVVKDKEDHSIAIASTELVTDRIIIPTIKRSDPYRSSVSCEI